MGILVCGLNHKSAPLAIRERLAVSPEQHQAYLASANDQSSISEVAVISTCNRTELICETSKTQSVLDWLSDRHHGQELDFQKYIYIHYNRAAVRHLMRVACGLDSMVLGEPQILGQIKQAYQQACNVGTIGPELGGVFRAVFSATKKIRTNTAIGANPVSLASTAVNLAKQKISDIAKTKVLLIGAGDTIELAARYLHQLGVRDFIIANRTLSRAYELAQLYDAPVIALNDISKHLSSVDLVISATTSTTPIITSDMMEPVIALRDQSNMTLIDLAVPRDISAEIASLPSVNLFNIDDLELLIADSIDERRVAAEQAEQIIELELAKYSRWQNYLKRSRNDSRL